MDQAVIQRPSFASLGEGVTPKTNSNFLVKAPNTLILDNQKEQRVIILWLIILLQRSPISPLNLSEQSPL